MESKKITGIVFNIDCDKYSFPMSRSSIIGKIYFPEFGVSMDTYGLNNNKELSVFKCDSFKGRYHDLVPVRKITFDEKESKILLEMITKTIEITKLEKQLIRLKGENVKTVDEILNHFEINELFQKNHHIQKIESSDIVLPK